MERYETSQSDDGEEQQTWLGKGLKAVSGLIWAEPVYDFENPAPFKAPKFEANDPAAAKYLDEHGYVVFRAAADAEQQAKAISLFWDFNEEKGPKLKRHDSNTWSNDNWLADTGVGIMSGHGVGQSAFLWHCRTLPKVKEAFANVWGTDDLLVSFDGCGVFRPPEANPKWKTFGGWHHIDQNCRNKPGRHAIQGLLNLFPSGEFDGGFIVVPKSNHMIDRLFAKDPNFVGPKARDYMRTPVTADFWQEEHKAIKRDSKNKHDLMPVKLVLDAGDFVMWDSRTIHCNHPVTKHSSDKEAANRLKRLAAYICMTPASSAKDMKQLAKCRVFAFQNGTTTTHWPHEFQPSWSYRTKIPGVGMDTVKLTPEQALLITGKENACDIYDLKVLEGFAFPSLDD